MYNIAKYTQKTLYNKSIDNTQKSMYNIITVREKEATKKGGGRMTSKEWQKLTREQKQEILEEYKKKAATCSNK